MQRPYCLSKLLARVASAGVSLIFLSVHSALASTGISSPAVVIESTAPGTVDRSFDPGGGPDDDVNVLAIQPDGKLLVGGMFKTFNGAAVSPLVRLNTDGQLDASFDSRPALAADAAVFAIALQPDGRILVGGGGRTDTTLFPELPSFASPIFLRLNQDGSFDSTFNAGQRFLAVTGFAVQSDGRILIAGSFASDLPGVLRVLSDGSPDTNFAPVTVQNQILDTVVPGRVDRVLLAPDNKILIAGLFTLVNDVAASGVARLNADGTVDASFAPEGISWPLAIQPDGRIVARSGSSLTRVDSDGRPDPGFDAGSGLGAGSNSPPVTPNLTALAIQPDGKIVIGGLFSTVNTSPRQNIARLNPNGTLDTSFDPRDGIIQDTSAESARVNALVIQSDGRIVVGGRFTTVNNVPRRNLARLWGGEIASEKIALDGVHFRSDGSFEVDVLTTAGVSYGLQSKSDLSQSRWATILRATGDGGVLHLIDTNLPAPQRFYRLLLE
jgi:uncharacterized delta-60 repeat protein